MRKIAAVFFILLTCQNIFGSKFMIPVLPDTQCEINYNPAMFTSQINWIVANKTTFNIPFVLHVGDIIDWDTTDHRMWNTAGNGFLSLDNAGIPYAVTLGNHDTAAVTVGGGAAPGDTHANLRITTQFNTFFPVSRFTAQQGRYESGKSDNAWYTFEAGGVQWLVLSLELWARQGPVDWAKAVVANHTNYNVIILTHSHLKSNGTIEPTNGGYGDKSPLSIYNEFISQYPNVLLVLSGHVSSSVWRNDAGVHGNRIYQILQDYQGEDSGGGYIRLLEIDTTNHIISAKMYSPYYNIRRADSSQFSFFNVNFVSGLSPIVLVGPANGSMVDANGAVFSCQASQSAVRYQLLMGSDPCSVNLMISETNQPPQIGVSTFPYETTYWTVKAYDQFGSSIVAVPRYVNAASVARPILNPLSNDYLTCSGYELVWQKSFSQTVFEYCFKMKVKNMGFNSIQNVTMDVNSVPDNITAINDKAYFSSIPAQQEVLSNDTFIVQIDNEYDANENDIVWQASNKLEEDFTGEGNINFADLSILKNNWLRTGSDMTVDLYKDQVINFLDFNVLSEHWQ